MCAPRARRANFRAVGNGAIRRAVKSTYAFACISILSAVAVTASTRVFAEDATPSIPSPGKLERSPELEALEARIDALLSKIARVSTTVGLLRDSVVGGAIEQGRTAIVHRNEMGAGYFLEEARYLLDGNPIFEKKDPDGTLDSAKEIELFSGPLAAGEHELQVQLFCRGTSMGVFSYHEGYKFKIDSKYRLEVPEGRAVRVNVVAFSREGIAVAAEKRLAVRWDVQIPGLR